MIFLRFFIFIFAISIFIFISFLVTIFIVLGAISFLVVSVVLFLLRSATLFQLTFSSNLIFLWISFYSFQGEDSQPWVIWLGVLWLICLGLTFC